LEFTFCSRDPGKNVGFAMWSLGAVAGAGWANSGDVSPESGREGKGGSYGSLALGFVVWTGPRRLQRWGTPAASGVGRRGWQCQRPGPPAVVCRWAASCCGARVGAEVLWVALGMAEEAAPAASSLAAVADGVGLRPE
jgi:hypothetical protein